MKQAAEHTVFIVDDDEAVRGGLEMLVKSVGLSVKTFEHGQAFLDQYEPADTGCLVLDIRMPIMGGLELQQELRNRNSSLPIIFITGHGDIPMAVKAVIEGAVDFISKPFRDQELLDCIQRAIRGLDMIQDRNLVRSTITTNLAKLSPREKEVMDMVIEGKANKVIAMDLNLSERTVEVHRSHVMEKMQTRSLAKLVQMVTFLHN